MERKLYVLLPSIATTSLFPASQPYSEYAHSLHTCMDKVEASQVVRPTVWEERDVKEQNVFRLQGF